MENKNKNEIAYKVLSLFDGLSCGRIALERAGINVEKYYASEIDKYAIQISKKNYPDIIHIGDITKIDFNDYRDVDIIIGGSPCQDLSIAKNNRQGLNGSKSLLFYKFVEAIETIKPKYFLLENVASMSKENKDIITKILGVEPILINSSLLSAQQRKRLYWCNWKVEQPKDKGILLKDILENNVDNKYNISEKHTQAMINCKNSKKLNIPDLNGKCGTIIASYYKIPQDAPYIENFKNCVRKLTPLECERLQTLTIKKRYAKITIENKKIELEWLKECQKTDVQNVEEKCLKLQNAAGSVENLDLKGFVQYVEKNLNIKNQQINKPVQLNVHINLEELNIQIDFLKGLLKNVSCAEKSLNLAHQEKIEDFVLSIVGILIKLEKEVQTGRVELHQKDKQFILQRYENNELKMFGEEIMQLAKNVEKDLTTHRKLLKSIILEDLNLKTQEKNLVILFCYVMNVINSFTPKETKTEILFQINGGYTYGISNTQRYKCIGNGWTVDVIAHIFKGLLNNKE